MVFLVGFGAVWGPSFYLDFVRGLREEFLRLLREDEEFRFAVLGLLGIGEVLRRIEENTGAIRALQEQVKALQEEVRVLAEAVAGHGRVLEEHGRAIRALQEEVARHAEVLERLGRRVEEHARAVGELMVAMGSIGRRWGRDLERAVLEIYRHVLEERGIEPGRVERFVFTDVDGRFLRPGARIEVDVYVHNGSVTLIEVKAHAELDDVEWFFEKARVVERVLGRRVDRLVIVAVNIDEDALRRAGELGIDVVYGSVVS